MLNQIENIAIDLKLHRLFVGVSITAKPFFLNKGFKVTVEQEVIYRSIKFKIFTLK